MVAFWQLSGPESHFYRDWKVAPGELSGNAKIAQQVFRSMSRKQEDGGRVVDFTLGIKISGSTHILLPEETRKSLRELSWRDRNPIPYPPCRFASLSPIIVGIERFQILLDDRQVVSKATKSSKMKGDNSKANQVFWDGPPRPERAAFEHCRCFWKILHQELLPQTYGLPSAPWSGGLHIISLAMNFWSADGSTFLDAGMTLFHLPSGVNHVEYTWYFKSRDCDFLQNSSETVQSDIPSTWDKVQVDDNKELIGKKIQDILQSNSHPKGSPPAPLILLVHDYSTVKDQLESMGIQTMMWKSGIKDLLGCHLFDQVERRKISQDPGNSLRARSMSPLRSGSSIGKLTDEAFHQVLSYAPVYIMDTMVMFKTVTGTGNHSSTIRPVDIFNKITGNDERDGSCGGSDSIYTMQSWKAMVAGTSIDEQKACYANYSMTLAAKHNEVPHVNSDIPQDAGLYQVEQPYDIFNDGSDSDED